MPKKITINYEDIEREIVQGDEIISEKIDAETQKRVIKQIEEEYQLAYQFNDAKRKVNLARLRLFNNQMRDNKAVGDPLMFTVFNTVHAALYDDRLTALWHGRGGKGDEDIEENLNALSEYDYDVMEKAKVDYMWNWDTEFFGRGLLLLMDFDRSENKMCPVPEVLDAATWIRDPRATSVNGDMSGKGAMRFGGREVGATYYELKNLAGYFNISALKKDKEIKSTIDEARQARRLAQGLENFSMKEESLGKYDNYEFRLLDWFTTIKGEKYLVTLGNNRSIIVRMIKLDKYAGKFPIIDRCLYPMSNDWDGVSIPDLTEDKQRARAVLLNIAMESAKSEVTPSYLFDKTRIKNKNDLNFKINKFIGVDGRVDNAMLPVQKSTAHQYASLIMEVLDTSAQRATAATELRQGIQASNKTTLGEQELAAAGGDKRFSMTTKIYGWSEADFWRQWYMLYKIHFKDKIDEKILRIQGSLAPTWRPLTRENIISNVDPDVKIESKALAEQKRQREAQNFGQFVAIAMADPSSNKRFIEKHMARLQGMTREQINLAFPPTVDELQAEDENVLLNAEKLPPVSLQDDHQTHLEIHSKANQNAYTIAHMQAHKKLMVVKRDRPDLAPPPQGIQVPGQAAQPAKVMPNTPVGASQ